MTYKVSTGREGERDRQKIGFIDLHKASGESGATTINKGFGEGATVTTASRQLGERERGTVRK